MRGKLTKAGFPLRRRKAQIAWKTAYMVRTRQELEEQIVRDLHRSKVRERHGRIAAAREARLAREKAAEIREECFDFKNNMVAQTSGSFTWLRTGKLLTMNEARAYIVRQQQRDTMKTLMMVAGAFLIGLVGATFFFKL